MEDVLRASTGVMMRSWKGKKEIPHHSAHMVLLKPVELPLKVLFMESDVD